MQSYQFRLISYQIWDNPGQIKVQFQSDFITFFMTHTAATLDTQKNKDYIGLFTASQSNYFTWLTRDVSLDEDVYHFWIPLFYALFDESNLLTQQISISGLHTQWASHSCCLLSAQKAWHRSMKLMTCFRLLAQLHSRQIKCRDFTKRLLSMPWKAWPYLLHTWKPSRPGQIWLFKIYFVLLKEPWASNGWHSLPHSRKKKKRISKSL